MADILASNRNTRARDALRGEWLPGMCVLMDGAPGRLVRRRADRAWQGLSWEGEKGGYLAMFPPPEGTWVVVPDLDDPVTELALIAVLERRTSGPVGADRHPRAGLPDWRVTWRSDGEIACVRGDTRCEALIAALEAT